MSVDRKANPAVDKPAWAQRLASIRKRRRLAQTALASGVEASQSTIASYETGQNEPSLHMFRRLAAFLGCSPGYLAFGDETASGEKHDEKIGLRGYASSRLSLKQTRLLIEILIELPLIAKEEGFLEGLRVEAGLGNDRQRSFHFYLSALDEVYERALLHLDDLGVEQAATLALEDFRNRERSGFFREMTDKIRDVHEG